MVTSSSLESFNGLMRQCFVLVVILLLTFEFAFSQCNSPNIISPDSICKNQNIFISTDSISSNYRWDFCAGDFNQNPSASVFQNTTGGAHKTSLVEYNGQYYGFFYSRSNRSFYRLDFGTDIKSNPQPVSLGSLGTNSAGILAVEIINEGGVYVGLLIDYFNMVYRINFGASITNQPSNAEIIYQNGLLSNPIDLCLASDASGKYAFIANIGSNNLTVLSFGNSFLQNSGSISTSPITITGSGNLGGIDFASECGQWYAFSSSINGQVSKLVFSSGLNNLPLVSQLTGLTLPPSSGGIQIAFENANYYVFTESYETQSELYKIDFGNSLSNNPKSSVNLGAMGMGMNFILGFSMHKVKSDWLILASENTGQYIYRITFDNPCFGNLEFSTQMLNEIESETTGSFYISLTRTNSLGYDETASHPIAVSSMTSPDIGFTTLNNCTGNAVTFNSVNQSNNLTMYKWNFGDGAVDSVDTNPSHIYSNASVYYPSLAVTASNGCQNFAQDTIQIFNPPQANFSLPIASPLCTNQNYLFTNNSTFDLNSNPTWQWSVNGNNISTASDLNYLFSSSASQSITLTASIPGCSSQSTQAINNLVNGPLVQFNSATSVCQGTSIAFTNTTIGSTTSNLWTYGDGNSSSNADGLNTYSSLGAFIVTLNSSNSAGCQNSYSKSITVYSVPQPNFVIEGPPSACTNSLSYFDNSTPALTDSNITSWLWNFGDGSPSSTLPSPTNTYTQAGSFKVTLQATSNFGCTNSVTLPVTISLSPQADFTNLPACVGQSTVFSDASQGNISKYQWNFQGATTPAFGQTASYVFKSDGTFNVTLTVTDSKNCSNQKTRSIVVPKLPTVDFSISAPCTGHPTTFQEVYPGGVDPAVSWNWNFEEGSGVGSPVSFQFSDSTGYTITMSTTRQSGCVYSISKNITVYPGPKARFTPSVLAGGAPLEVTFTNTSMADSTLWQFDDAAQTTSKIVSPTFVYSQLGKYRPLLTVKNSLNCFDTLSTEIDVVIPHIDFAMENFSLTNDPTSNSSKAVVTILNSGNIPMMNPEVDIDLGGGALIKQNITGLVRPGKSIIQTLGVDIVPRTLSYICAEIEVPGDVDESNNSQCISLSGDDVILTPYPNPASTKINFNWIGANEENVTVTIYKSDGGSADQQNFENVQPGLSQLTINTSSLSTGLYLIQFAGRSTTKTFKIMIIH